uniref:Uncharacterized protein n=1 Tax=viral metagenome TaxID=1070528 RepID=A0A6C0EA50_9ZZZZ
MRGEYRLVEILPNISLTFHHGDLLWIFNFEDRTETIAPLLSDAYYEKYKSYLLNLRKRVRSDKITPLMLRRIVIAALQHNKDCREKSITLKMLDAKYGRRTSQPSA